MGNSRHFVVVVVVAAAVAVVVVVAVVVDVVAVAIVVDVVGSFGTPVEGWGRGGTGCRAEFATRDTPFR